MWLSPYQTLPVHSLITFTAPKSCISDRLEAVDSETESMKLRGMRSNTISCKGPGLQPAAQSAIRDGDLFASVGARGSMAADCIRLICGSGLGPCCLSIRGASVSCSTRRGAAWCSVPASGIYYCPG